MKFLFINAIDTTQAVQRKYPPLGIGHLISALREGFPDQIEFRVVDRDIEKTLKEFKPDIVGISSVTQNFNRAIEYAKTVKEFDPLTWVLVGGVHISMVPSSLTEDMDVGIIGEGELTICELVDFYLNFRVTDFRGIIYHENGKVRATEKRPPIKPLDSLPPPARDLFPVLPETYMFTSRGCPYKCSFCSSTRFWKGVRYFSPEYIVAEIERLKGARSINFYDDIFPLSIQRVRRTTALLREKGLLGTITFSCAIRANMVNDEIILALKEMGVTSIGLGLESGSEHTLQYLKGPTVTLSDNENAIHTIKRHGLEVSGTFIIGSPHESYFNVMETYDFIKKHRLAAVCVYPLTPLPGTPVWDYALSRGLVSEPMDWSRLDVEHSHPIVLSERLTREQLTNLLTMFSRLRARRHLFRLTRVALRHPTRIPTFVYRKLLELRYGK